MTTRVPGRGTVRRLAFGAALAALAATSSTFAGTVAADDRPPEEPAP